MVKRIENTPALGYNYKKKKEIKKILTIKKTENNTVVKLQLRQRAKHDEAQALYNARKQEREKRQSALAEKDSLIAELKAKLGLQ